ncbi:phosphonate transport system substrate-binding protein [Chromohalobacter marismortui]|uniref:Phosphonate transport system substrate-binding protein n=1 Tax=Chromohalobacter marismortui TaxID=42055 RepID=A0A4R7NNW1_9GAMM|nr:MULTISPECIES: phosphonate ABC transporter substrate-binding protein [Chromohalobacter]MCI0509539.1 phosphonate ABC transporter substrate-binding protein [Chromohalobacter sp.]MCI0592567.1 phosphonate ABC transporter substrate-binding protein [Chromohalobacter sp.]TDU22259.1 phosphonate transport system substrate-binding protein [Chromohalobacter marismortui]
MALRSLHRLALPLIATIGIGGGLPAHAQEHDTLTFGIISTESMNAQREMFQPLLDDMSDAMGMQVEPFFATDYAGVIQAMRFDKVDVAWYGNKAAMEAVDRAGGEIFAQTVAANGEPGYWSLMIVNQDSPYDSVDEILDNADQLVFGNGDPNSTSGYLVPGYYIFAKNGVEAASAFKRTLNSSHETNALSVANHMVDVATFNTESMARLEETHPEKAEQLKVIWKSPLIPSDPLVWREDLPEATKEKLREFFLNYGDTEREQEILTPLQWSGFQPSSNAQLLPIRQLALFKERANVANDDSLDAQEKEQKLNALDARLEKLDQRMGQQANADTTQQAS